MSRHNVVLLLICTLTACGSNPVDDNYYSLVLAADDVSAPQSKPEALAKLIVGPIYLPEYLQRRGLSMQIGDNRIHTANHHLWAEPLEEAISKVLVRDINGLAGDVSAERAAGRWTGAASCRLRLEFDKFHATDRSTVVSSGRYWLTSSHASVRQQFDIDHRLSADGHVHAVSVLRESLKMLAEQIIRAVHDHSVCWEDDIVESVPANGQAGQR